MSEKFPAYFWSFGFLAKGSRVVLCLERLQESQIMNEIISREHPQYRLIRHHGKLGDAISAHLLHCCPQLCIRSDRLHLFRRYHGLREQSWLAIGRAAPFG